MSKRSHRFQKDTSKHTNMKNTMTRKSFYEVINNGVFIQHEIRHIFQLRPTFVKYTEIDEVYRKLNRTKILTQNEWENLCGLQGGWQLKMMKKQVVQRSIYVNRSSVSGQLTNIKFVCTADHNSTKNNFHDEVQHLLNVFTLINSFIVSSDICYKAATTRPCMRHTAKFWLLCNKQTAFPSDNKDQSQIV